MHLKHTSHFQGQHERNMICSLQKYLYIFQHIFHVRIHVINYTTTPDCDISMLCLNTKQENVLNVREEAKVHIKDT